MARPPSLRIYVPDAPPAGTDPVLAAWLTGELYRISQIAALGADTGDGQDGLIVGHTHNGTDSSLVPHNNTSDRDVLDCHPQNSITGLVAGQTAQDDELARLEQDKLNTADALVVFSFAAYANLESPNNSAFPDLGAAWQKLDILTATTGVVTPRGITVDRPNSSFTFDYDGVYRISLTGSFEHVGVNTGRITYVRIYNETTASGDDGLVLGTGRNAEATTISASFLAEVGEAQKGDVFSFQIGNGDAYTAVNFQTLGVAINAVSEWREPITGAGG